METNQTNSNSSDFRQNFSLWNEFLLECQTMIEGDNQWKSVKLNQHPTDEEQFNIINQIYIKNATLPQIVRRHRLYKKL